MSANHEQKKKYLGRMTEPGQTKPLIAAYCVSGIEFFSYDSIIYLKMKPIYIYIKSLALVLT